MKLSAFTFIHNGIIAGYPFVEAILTIKPYVDEVVVVDMASNDDTVKYLDKLDVKIVQGRWGNQAGDTLREAHNMHVHCSGDVIIHFEADEVYDLSLLNEIVKRLKYDSSITSYKVYRLQVEQNYQRVRWYPELVHRVFPNFSGVTKAGHTTNQHDGAVIIEPEHGFLWDCTNNHRDNYLPKIHQQAQLWHSKPNYIYTPLHVLNKPEISPDDILKRLGEVHWKWKTTPLNIPEILKGLVGMTRYNPDRWF